MGIRLQFGFLGYRLKVNINNRTRILSDVVRSFFMPPVYSLNAGVSLPYVDDIFKCFEARMNFTDKFCRSKFFRNLNKVFEIGEHDGDFIKNFIEENLLLTRSKTVIGTCYEQ